ncbi:hypothetical protein ACPESR_25215 [Nocardia testacea]|uniref:hypothetical protein n=1 Tax=Nocardia testacea TaxID=248551 RepID=UPI003C2F7C37
MAERRPVLRIDRNQLAHQLTGPQGVLVRTVAIVSRRVESNASQRAPVDTGNMRRMIRQDPITVSGLTASGGVTSHANYSAAVHNGSGPYVIRPRRAKALRFQIGGRTIFAAKVNHPGTRGRPFLANAAAEEAARIGARFEQ